MLTNASTNGQPTILLAYSQLTVGQLLVECWLTYWPMPWHIHIHRCIGLDSLSLPKYIILLIFGKKVLISCFFFLLLS